MENELAKVRESLEKAPWCYYNEQIVKVLHCHCGVFRCPLNNLCNQCYINGFRHYIYYLDCDKSFKKKYKPLSRKTSFNEYRLRP